MSKESIIKCPKCGIIIDINKALYQDIEADIKKGYEEKVIVIEKEKQKEQEKLESEYQSKLKSEKADIEKKLREKVEHEKMDEIELLKQELQTKSNQVKELNFKNIEIERLKREKDELKGTIELEKEKELTTKLNEEKIKIRRSVEEENSLKIKERDKLIDDLKSQIDETKRKAEQGSVQLQGEIQELEIEDILRNSYAFDDISEVKKGQKGADIIQTVKDKNGVACGRIYYESKRTKKFDNNWLQKFKDDNLTVNADVLVLITETMPEGVDKYILKDGIWICSFLEFKPLALLLRHTLLEIQKIRIVQQGKESTMESVYNYLTSQEFKGQFEAIVGGFRQLQEGYNDEKLKMQKIWKEREKQLEKILANSVNMYGSLKGLAGNSIPDIKMLEN